MRNMNSMTAVAESRFIVKHILVLSLMVHEGKAFKYFQCIDVYLPASSFLSLKI